MRHTVLLVPVLLSLLACKKSEESTPTAAAASTAPPPAVTAAAPPAVAPKIASRDVPSGWTADKRYFVQGFKAQLPEGAPFGVSWAAARKACDGAGLDLCSEEQWTLACAADSSIGTTPSWTIQPASGTDWVVRGGSGCAEKSAASGVAAPGRIGLCCERRASISTSANRQEAVMKASQTYIGNAEEAVNSRVPDRIVKLIADDAQLYKTQTNPGKARKDLEADNGRYTESSVRMLRCEADNAKPDGFFECDTVGTRTKAGGTTPELSVFRQRFEMKQFKYTVFGDPRTIARPWGPF